MIQYDTKDQVARLKVREEEFVLVTSWEIWFQTPGGLCKDVAQAIGWCVLNDMNPALIIRPVVVAVSEAGEYEVV